VRFRAPLQSNINFQAVPSIWSCLMGLENDERHRFGHENSENRIPVDKRGIHLQDGTLNEISLW
jgi:hypothetical protein